MTTETAAQDLSRSFRRRGVVILSLFAVLWAAVGASGVTPSAAWPVRIGAMVVAVAIIAVALRRGQVVERHRQLPAGWRRTIGLVNGAQLVAIAIIVVLGITLSVPQIVPPAVCLVVGLHFFPLAGQFDQPQYTWTAVGLCGAALLGFLLLAVIGQEASRVVVGFVGAAALWGTALRLAAKG